MAYLFIGGVADGRRIETNGEQSYTCAELPKWKLQDQDPYRDWTDEYQRSHYRAVKFTAGGSTTLVYADESIYRQARSAGDLDELVLHALIDGYRGQEDEQRRPPPFKIPGSERPAAGTSSGEKPSSPTDTEKLDYKAAIQRELRRIMTEPPQMTEKPSEPALTFMGTPVTMDEIMRLTMQPDCSCPICTAKREGKPIGPEELKFLGLMMEQLEAAYAQKQQLSDIMYRELWKGDRRPVDYVEPSDYGTTEMRLLRRYMAEEEKQRIPPPQPAYKRLASPKTFDNSAPKRFKGKRS